MKKSVSIAAKPGKRSAQEAASSADALDAFVRGPDTAPASSAKPLMKRLTFDIDARLHKRIRLACFHREKDMAEEIRRILEEHFPAA